MTIVRTMITILAGTSITFATEIGWAADQFGPGSVAHVFEPRGSTFS